jgi:Ca2+:H+ antiporter
MKLAPAWTLVAPVAGWLLLGGTYLDLGGAYLAAVAVGLGACIMAGVYHAEVVAHRVGEPFGTLILAVAITVIEVALILVLMAAGGDDAKTVARDTVFAAVMIILNGIVGLCLLAGGMRYHEQEFTQQGTTASLTTVAAIAVLTLILPNYTSTTPGPYYSASQLAFIAVVSLVLYGTFVVVQTVRHRRDFLQADAEEPHLAPPTDGAAIASGVMLVIALGAVVLDAKALAPTLEKLVLAVGAPQAGVGVLIAMLVLGPEGYSALRAARANRLQTSLNLALGSAIASIGLTIPSVAVLSMVTGTTLALGLDSMGTALLVLSLFIAALSLSTGRTTVLQGVVHLVIFAVYLFTTVVP